MHILSYVLVHRQIVIVYYKCCLGQRTEIPYTMKSFLCLCVRKVIVVCYVPDGTKKVAQPQEVSHFCLFVTVGLETYILYIICTYVYDLSSYHISWLAPMVHYVIVGWKFTFYPFKDLPSHMWIHIGNTPRNLFDVVRQQPCLLLFKTVCMTSVILSTKCHLFYNFIFFSSNYMFFIR